MTDLVSISSSQRFHYGLMWTATFCGKINLHYTTKMSYKEVREFVETMTDLQCSDKLEIDSFQYPDFPLVAKLLYWLVTRCDPGFQIPLELDAEQDRVFFLRAVTDHMNSRYNITVDPRKLYIADGHAVREMLKIARLLKAAKALWTTSDPKAADPGDEDLKDKVIAKVLDLRTSRKSRGTAGSDSAEMFELLKREPANHIVRLNALNLRLDPDKVEQSLTQSITEAEEAAADYLERFDNIKSDKANLEAKIRKREEELDRMQRRYKTLQTSKPTVLDENHRLETELKHMYGRYSATYRNLVGLEEHVRKMEIVLEKNELAVKGKDESEEQRIDDLSMLGVDTQALDDGFNEDLAGDHSEHEAGSRRPRGLVVRGNAVDEVSTYSRGSPEDNSDAERNAGQENAAKLVNGNPTELSSDEDF